MRFSDSANREVLENATQDGLSVRHAVWLTLKHPETGAAENFGFWTEPLPELVAVAGALDGATVNRLYEGDGALLAVGKIALSADIKIRNVELTLSKNNDRVALAARFYKPKGGRVEIHRILLSPVSRRPVGVARARFLGQIDRVKVGRPAAGGEGTLILQCISDTAQLAKTNPAKRSTESQQLRVIPALANAPDQNLKYADTCHLWDVPWGEDPTAPPATSRARRGILP